MIKLFSRTTRIAITSMLVPFLFSCATHKKLNNQPIKNPASADSQKGQNLSIKTSKNETEGVGAPSKYTQQAGVVGANEDSTLSNNNPDMEYNIDPYEKMNRVVFSFNSAFDKVLLKPTARIYDFVTPHSVQRGVGNFFDNLALLPTIAGDILQVKFGKACRDVGRLAVNTTVGVGGLVDVASKWGMPRKEEDMGLTFAKWGNKQSPYVVIPFLGPSTLRDAVGMTPDFFVLSAWPYIKPVDLSAGLLAVDLVDRRANLLSTDKAMEASFDPYVAMRSAYLQYRAHQIEENNEKGNNQANMIPNETSNKKD